MTGLHEASIMVVAHGRSVLATRASQEEQQCEEQDQDEDEDRNTAARPRI
jgi:hypothetical protein